MQKLVDQSQQLQLMAEKKIAALEAAPKETDKSSQPIYGEPVSETATKNIKKEPRPQKRGFWHRIFK